MATTPAATATERAGDRRPVVRNNLATRSLHGATALCVAVLLGTGWWIWSGHEGRPSVLARALDEPDVEIHRTAGWTLVVLAGLAVTAGVRGAVTFVRETARADRGDLRWFRRWPVGAVTGRFPPHRGVFDPGQRVANVLFVVSLAVVIGSGVALTTLSGGPTFATMVRVHRCATVALTVFVVGHLVVVSGLLPGYRGVWRAMVGRGRAPRATVRRLWPRSVPDEPGPPDRAAPPDTPAG
ncbi:MAG TPA: cytochrome b/b6 domain-containing protein [Acidimicrobiales bacterium]|jgi:cytochrome b subunit of formate dehydrogenase|nr:cytochrome b/b6 domain-containing protein [Acidimicrobiales bacterium]